MFGFTGTQIALSVKLLLYLTVNGQTLSSFTVRSGDVVTLPCRTTTDDQVDCSTTTWIFTHSLYPTVELVALGRIRQAAGPKSHRLSVTENCSLVVEKVSVEDVGLYSCTQFDTSGRQRAPDVVTDLSVVILTERKAIDELVFFCSVFMYGPCTLSVQWLLTRPAVDEHRTAVATSQPDCLATVEFMRLHFMNESKYHELVQCEVTNRSGGDVQLFPFSLQSTDADVRKNTTEGSKAASDCSALTFIMLLMRVAELLLLTVITVLLIRAAVNQRAPERSPAGRRSGAAATQVHRDEDEGPVDYENSVRLH